MNLARKTWKLILLLTFVLGASSASVVVIHSEQQEYYGVCSKLSGFPGALQRAGLLQVGTCATKPLAPLCNSGASCTVSGKAGTCKNTAKPLAPAVCACVANAST